MLNIPIFHQYNGETKIALMDNSAVAFMEQVERNGVSAKELLREYDAVFIPNWVIKEVSPIDMSAYSDWISEMYRNWPLSDTNTENGRMKKKNAGEISLTILAEVFSWYYPDTELITVYTQDRDSFDYQMSAHRQLEKVFQERVSVDVSYKSNDFLLYQMYRSGTITREKINDVRKDERVVTYTKRRPDQAVALASIDDAVDYQVELTHSVSELPPGIHLPIMMSGLTESFSLMNPK